jgi:hypothetical protein
LADVAVLCALPLLLDSAPSPALSNAPASGIWETIERTVGELPQEKIPVPFLLDFPSALESQLMILV